MAAEQKEANAPFWGLTALRITDPAKSVPFYVNNFGMTLVDELVTEKLGLYFLATLKKGEAEKLPKAGTDDAHKNVWAVKGRQYLLLKHTPGDEKKQIELHSGNVKPQRGFGHIAFAADSVQDACAILEKADDMAWQKKCHEGNMKDIAFCKDPDGTWIEIISRKLPENHEHGYYFLGQTMLRINKPEAAIKFLREALGLKRITEKHFAKWKFSLYFLAASTDVEEPKDPTSPESWQLMKSMPVDFLELTHNHVEAGKEDEEEVYVNATTDPLQAFQHIGFVVDDVEATTKKLEALGCKFTKKSNDGPDMFKGIAFTNDNPLGYTIELIQRGFSFGK